MWIFHFLINFIEGTTEKTSSNIKLKFKYDKVEKDNKLSIIPDIIKITDDNVKFEGFRYEGIKCISFSLFRLVKNDLSTWKEDKTFNSNIVVVQTEISEILKEKETALSLKI